MSDKYTEIPQNHPDFEVASKANGLLGDARVPNLEKANFWQKIGLKKHNKTVAVLGTDKGAEVISGMENELRDSLTGLPNRRAFEIELNEVVSENKRSGIPFSLINLDLKQFKKINDVHGHPQGDKALIYASKFLLANIRPSDLACRVGGDEFIIILRNTKKEDGEKLLDRISTNLKVERELLPQGAHIEKLVDLNYSVDEWSLNDDVTSFLTALDAKMYEQKRS